MPEISNYELYDVNDLIHKWESGWREFAQMGERLFIPKYKTIDKVLPVKFPSQRIWWDFHEVYQDMVRSENKGTGIGLESIFLLAATPKNKSFTDVLNEPYDRYIPKHLREGGSSRGEARRRKIIGRVTNAFANSTTVEKAFSKISTIRQLKEYAKNLTPPWGAGFEKELVATIHGRWAELMKWLDYGLQSDVAYEEAYWNCVWLYTEANAQVMLEIKNRIDTHIPLTDCQYNLLNNYMSFGRPTGYCIVNTNKSKTYKLLLESESKRTPVSTFSEAAGQFLAQPAFDLAGELQRKFSKPRFVKQCHAPSCGKIFYTGHKNATNCPGSQGYRKNKCALEWIRYKRYLNKIGKVPEKDWNSKQLQKDFISYDKD